MQTKNWFNRLLISYLPAFLIISASLLTTMFLVIGEISKKATLHSNDVLTLNLMQQLDASLNEIETAMMQEITKNQALADFYSRTADDDYIGYRAAVALKSVLFDNPLVDSAYLYRSADDTVVTPYRIASLQQFGDGDFIRKSMGSLDRFEWEGPRSYRDCLEFCAEQEVVTLVRAPNFIAPGLIVVNVRTSALRSLIEQSVALDVNQVRLTNADGQPLLASSAAAAESTASGSGSKLTSDYTGWTLRTFLISDKLFSFVSNLFYVWVSIAVAIVFLGVVWVIVASRRHYKPVKTILKEIDQTLSSKLDAATIGKDEFRYISSALQKLSVTSHQLQDENNQHVLHRRPYLFQELLNGNFSYRHNDPLAELKRSGLHEAHGMFRVAVIEIDDYPSFEADFPAKDREQFRFMLKTIVEEVAASAQLPVWSEWIAPNLLGAIHACPVDQPDTGTLQVSERVRQSVELNLEYTVTIGCGTCVSAAEEIAASFESALRSLAYKTSLGGNRVMDADDLANQPKGELFRQLNHIHAIAQQFRLGHAEWISLYREFYGKLQGQLFSKEDLINLFQYLIYHLQKEMAELPKPFQDIWSQDTAPRLEEALERVNTLKGIGLSFESILEEAAASMDGLRQNDTRFHVIQKVKRYIEESYADPDLSLSRIGELFELSPSHLSRMFKEELGMNFIDYVTQVRIAHAVRLLEHTTDLIQDIAVQVGYANSLTFIRVFKKITGITPGSHRLKTNAN